MGVRFLDDLAIAHRLDLLLLVYLVPAINFIPTVLALISVARHKGMLGGSALGCGAARWWFRGQLASGLIALMCDLYSWSSIQASWADALRDLGDEEMLLGSEIADASNEIFYIHFFGLLLCMIPLLGAVCRAVTFPAMCPMDKLPPPNPACSGAAWRGDQGDRELKTRLAARCNCSSGRPLNFFR